MPLNHLVLCCPLLLPPSIFPSNGVFSNESALHIRWPKSWSFNFSISSSNEQSGLISLRNDSFDLFAVQGTFRSLLQHHSSKASVLSHLYGPNITSIHDYWKNHSFDYIAFVNKVIFLLFNILSRFVIVFLPRSKHLLISWLQSTVHSDFGAQESKICHCFCFCLIYLLWIGGTKCHELSFLNVEF